MLPSRLCVYYTHMHNKNMYITTGMLKERPLIPWAGVKAWPRHCKETRLSQYPEETSAMPFPPESQELSLSSPAAAESPLLHWGLYAVWWEQKL